MQITTEQAFRGGILHKVALYTSIYGNSFFFYGLLTLCGLFKALSCRNTFNGSLLLVLTDGVRRNNLSFWCFMLTYVSVPSSIYLPSSTFCGVKTHFVRVYQGFVYARTEREIVGRLTSHTTAVFLTPFRIDLSTSLFSLLLTPVM